MGTLKENIEQAVSDFDGIENAIEASGVDVPYGTDTSEYANLIGKATATMYNSGYTSGLNDGTGVDVAGLIEQHNTSENAHADIFGSYATKNQVANALTETLSGANIMRCDDVSPIEQNLAVTVHGNTDGEIKVKNPTVSAYGKNLGYFTTLNSKGYTFSGNTLIIKNPTVANIYDTTKYKYLPVGTYTISATITGSREYATKSLFQLRFFNYNTNSALSFDDFTNGTMTKSITVKVADSAKYINFANVIFGEIPTSADLNIKIQIEQGDTATEIMPYVDPTVETITAEIGTGETAECNTLKAVYPITTVIVADENDLLKNADVTFNRDIKSVETDVEMLKEKTADMIYGFDIQNWKKRVIDEQLKNDFSWKTADKVYVTFTFDDSMADISDILTLFKSKSLPCCFATIFEYLGRKCNDGRTVKDVLLDAQSVGCEILAHGISPIKGTSADSYYKYVFEKTLKELYNAGFDVNGIMTIGGTDYDKADFKKCVQYMRPYYQYSDLYGTGTGTEQYYNMRTFISTLDAAKTKIDTAVNAGGGVVHFGCHAADITIIGNIIDYAVLKGATITTWQGVYNALRSSKLEKALQN